jgi:hypothetical protein
VRSESERWKGAGNAERNNGERSKQASLGKSDKLDVATLGTGSPPAPPPPPPPLPRHRPPQESTSGPPPHHHKPVALARLRLYRCARNVSLAVLIKCFTWPVNFNSQFSLRDIALRYIKVYTRPARVKEEKFYAPRTLDISFDMTFLHFISQGTLQVLHTPPPAPPTN